MKEERALAQPGESRTVENPPGILRTTMAYNRDLMLCHFILKPGAEIPLHNHEAVQNGYIIRGKVKFKMGDGSSFMAEAGTGYVFASRQTHGAEVLEESEAIECFAPMRPEYAAD